MQKIQKYCAVITVLAILVLPVFTACSKSGAARTAKELKRFDLPFQPTGYTNILFVIAKEEGYYAETGLDVQFTPINGSSMDLVTAAVTGKVKAATYGGTATPLTLAEGGADLVIIGGVMSEGATLVTTPENLSKWPDFSESTLAGKKIAITRVNNGDITFRRYLKRNGVDISKINVIELDSPPTIIEAVKKGEVDAGIVYVFFRKVAENQGLSTIKHIDELVPEGYVCCRVTTTRQEINENRSDYVNLLKGNIRAYKIFRDDPEKTLEIASRYYDVDTAVLKNEFYEYGHLGFSPDPAKKRIEDFYEGMTQIGYSSGALDVSKHVDTSIYRDALDQVLAEYPGENAYLELDKHFAVNN
jgi:NitT/TauT family transport system substrate-binding protein